MGFKFHLFFLISCLVFCGCYSQQNDDMGRAILLNKVINIAYVKTLRPNILGAPVNITATSWVLQIFNVDEGTSEFSVELFFRQNWNDPRLAYSNDSNTIRAWPFVALSEDEAKKIWVPDTFVVNAKEMKTDDIPLYVTAFTRLYPNGNITRSTKLTITAHCVITLQGFPSDKQTCSLDFESYGYSAKDVVYSWDNTRWGKALGVSNDIVLANYKLNEVKTTTNMIKLSSDSYSRIRAEFIFERISSRYITHIYLPSFLIVCLSLISLWIDSGDFVALSLSIVTLVVMVIMHTEVNYILPSAHSYNTRLDIYVLLCLFLVCTILVFHLLLRMNLPFVQLSDAPWQSQDNADLVEGGDSHPRNKQKRKIIVCFGRLRDINIDLYLRIFLVVIFVVINLIFLI